MIASATINCHHRDRTRFAGVGMERAAIISRDHEPDVEGAGADIITHG